jgi:Zn-dependent membrane protease YugP
MPYFSFYGFDIYYIILILPAFILSLIAQIKVKSTFSKYSTTYNSARLTGADAARRVLSAHGVYDVRIERVGGQLTDHFDPRTKVIRLSDSVYDSTSVAAVGVAAHEAGHAVQHAQSYAPIKIRNSLIPLVNFGSSISWLAILAGILLSNDLFIFAGIILFSFSTLFQLVTLPVELDASNRAMTTLRGEFLLRDERELNGARKVLTAAAMTYVAAVIMSLAQLLRLLLIFGKRRD